MNKTSSRNESEKEVVSDKGVLTCRIVRGEVGEQELHIDAAETRVSSANDIDVEIKGQQLEVKTMCGASLTYSHSSISNKVSAVFKRKKKKLILRF